MQQIHFTQPFRLIVRDGDSCKQVVTSNCTDELQLHMMELQLNEDGSAEAPTTTEPTATEEPTADPAKVRLLRQWLKCHCTKLAWAGKPI